MSSLQIDINDFSNGQINNTNPQEPRWEGNGIFDVIIKAANENIKIQHKTSRITGAEYAEVYLGTMQSSISEAMKFLLVRGITEKDIALKEKDIALKEKEIALKEKEMELTEKEILLKEAEIINNAIAGENLVKQGALLEEQTKGSYTERVMKDKQTAMLGMDGVMKTQNNISDPVHVYSPKYVE